MSHTIIYNPETHIIEATVQGTVNLNEMKEIFYEGVQIAMEKGIFLSLSDFREATSNLSTMDIYNLPKILSDIAIPLGLNIYKFKRAIVTAKDSSDFHFAENVTSNQGQNAKFFNDIEEAKKWLSEK